MKTQFVPILIFLCCFPGPPGSVGYLEQEERQEKEKDFEEERKRESDEAAAVQVEVPVQNREAVAERADYDNVGGYDNDEFGARGEKKIAGDENDKIEVRIRGRVLDQWCVVVN